MSWAAAGMARVARSVVAARYAVFALVSAIAIWEVVARSGAVQATVLPPFSDVMTALWNNRDVLTRESWVTLKEALYGFGLSVAVGIPLGIALALWRPIDRAVRPLLVAGQVTPKIALAPVFLMVFGFGTEPKVVLAFLLGFFPVVLDTILGLRSTQREKIYLARSCGAGWLAILFKIRLPNALPLIMTGLKIAATLSVTGAIVAEYISPGHGLGVTILAAGGELRTDLLYAAILCLGILGFALFLTISQIERVAVGWHPSQRSRRRR